MFFPFQKSCLQLFYCRNEHGITPQPLATAILVNINGCFLITAKHVFNKASIDEVGIITSDGKMARLYGDLGFYLGDPETDSIDIAVLKLPDPLIEELTLSHHFLHHKNIAFTNNQDITSQYFFYGFIAKQTSLRRKTFESTPFAMLTRRLVLKNIESMGYNDRENLLLVYNRRKQSFIDSHQINHGPNNLSGLSGGGVWEVKKNLGKNIFTLTGIMIEQRLDRGFIVSTRIHLILAILAQRFGVKIY